MIPVSAGGDANKAMNNGAIPIYQAAQNGHTETVEALIKNKADINRAMNDGIHQLPC